MGSSRERLWEELRALKGLWGRPWCVGGDFNVFRFPYMRRFSLVIDDLHLKDLPTKGGRFTWSGGLNGQRRARFDHFLINDEWENLFSPRSIFDHFPIALEGGHGIVRGSSLFRFENMWLKEEGFKTLIKEWWQGPSFRGSYSFILA